MRDVMVAVECWYQDVIFKMNFDADGERKILTILSMSKRFSKMFFLLQGRLRGSGSCGTS